MEENLDEILSDENSGPPLPSGDEAYLCIIISFTLLAHGASHDLKYKILTHPELRPFEVLLGAPGRDDDYGNHQ